MKFALLQLNPTVGDIEGNARRIADAVRTAASAGADLCVTPELALMGYPPRDLLLQGGFVSAAWERLAALALELKDMPPVLVGIAAVNDSGTGKPLHNCAALLYGGEVRDVFRKTLLPSYDVFDEDRYFEPGKGPDILVHKGRRIAVTICEDIWNDSNFWSSPLYPSDPLEMIAARGADIVVNLSASPFVIGKQRIRQDMLSFTARKYGMSIVYANQIGSNDDLVFAGRSMAFGPDGKLFARAKSFAEDILIVDTDARTGRMENDDFSPESESWRALVLGVRDYARKCGFRSALLGLSGGIDSSLVAAIAAEALGPENVLGVLMPSPWSSVGSITDAEELATNLGIRTRTIPIKRLMRSFDDALGEAFEGHPADVTEENIQARIRGNLLMAMSNKFRSLLLSTGNKSELAVGYCTIYGDMSGGLAVISDVPKTLVFAMCRWLNSSRGRDIIPANVISKPPSAELRPGQKDEDSLPPYEVLDAILDRLVVQRLSPDAIEQAGYDRATIDRVRHLLRIAEFKRRQAAPGIKITDRAFGTGWRMPLAARLSY
ncbi:NAD+ synthetase [Desulfobaculum xiamenense]|uniref:Glutamine-dependent NAD(+) synthetase n=1 Tax=Desulfobaculum xiamenense TaxID=995050 RepID=A0A846QQY1_9BACT|nr:NAD+ synthase [Desulfobaculum xiamenense]NJB67059.1 NAD+ synthetase [Desulfobaculum xiamenense]